MNWSAHQYTRFETERNRPIQDLLARIPSISVRTAADLGCGPGNSTELLQQRFPEAVITGMDNSPDMIEAARQRLPAIQFEVSDIATWSNPGLFDVILANAALQWVPHHEAVLPLLLNKLAPGGSLAIQMPDNFDEPAHRLMRETAAAGPWAEKLKGAVSRQERQPAEWYFSLLQHQVHALDIWRTTYYHPLAGGAGAVVEWFKGTGLRPYLAPLTKLEQQIFLEQYEHALALEYPVLSDGTVLLPFPRLFLVATRND
ncbi:trans-aconitate 2-methyltransferase [Larkinella insperata]|uniref:Trans-aconitate 2-methyltransferase n=1 Tax=Larkinella insperata TaxID=332158 RepID=A0ABW3Q2A3_9BACT|nr:trans-aconitate 2-methyltransferase [Larkinella insperata]